MLGVSISSNLKISNHVNDILASCVRSLFALRTLRAHGMPISALHMIYEATVTAKITYVSPAWSGFASASDTLRLENFMAKSTRLGYRSPSAATIRELFNSADKYLFKAIQ